MQLFQGDALHVMSKFKDNSIDAVICDPPYGTTKHRWDMAVDWAQWWLQVKRITKRNSPVIIFSSGVNSVDVINANRAEYRYTLIWAKNKSTGYLNAQKMPLRSHEDILVFYQKPPMYFPQKSSDNSDRKGWKRKASGDAYGSTQHNNYEGGSERHPTSVLNFDVVNNDSADRIHPSQKPTALLEFLLKSYTSPKSIVLDMYAGSGSLGQACRSTDRDAILIEKDEVYAEKCAKRLDNELIL